MTKTLVRLFDTGDMLSGEDETEKLVHKFVRLIWMTHRVEKRTLKAGLQVHLLINDMSTENDLESRYVILSR